MRPVLTAAQMRELERYTIEHCGISGRELMANAARAVLSQIAEHWPWRRQLLIVCGPGNNGGDGLAMALFAAEFDLEARVCLVDSRGKDAYREGSDPYFFLQSLQSQAEGSRFLDFGAIKNCLGQDRQELIVVDALFGTGLDRHVDEPYAGLIQMLNDLAPEMNVPVVAVDIPSGLIADTGRALGQAIRADLTVTFGHTKLGLCHPAATDHVGRLVVAEIELSRENPRTYPYDAFEADDQLPDAVFSVRRSNTHKGDYGKVLIIAGHRRYPGAPRLAAEGAARMGAGLVRLVVPDSIYNVSCSNPGIMVDGHPDDGFGGFAAVPSSAMLEYLEWADSVVIGPGLGSGEAAQALVRKLVAVAKQPLVLDADALRALPCPQSSSFLVLTPHAGELARLLEIDMDRLYSNWFEYARLSSQRTNAYVLAKSNQCVLASPDGQLHFPRRGHPAMAVGGSGDVLTGMIATLLAQTKSQSSLPDSVCAAVNIHSAAARLHASRRSETGMNPMELARFVPRAIEAEREKRWDLRL